MRTSRRTTHVIQLMRAQRPQPCSIFQDIGEDKNVAYAPTHTYQHHHDPHIDEPQDGQVCNASGSTLRPSGRSGHLEMITYQTCTCHHLQYLSPHVHACCLWSFHVCSCLTQPGSSTALANPFPSCNRIQCLLCFFCICSSLPQLTISSP